jgi:hypothetical protein
LIQIFMSLELTPKSRLHGKAVFLSASVPSPERREEYARIPEAPLRIEEAVICIARAVFVEGGTLVLGAHPSISPLVARVVDNYYLPAPAEDTGIPTESKQEQVRWRNPSVVIYQTEAWRPFWAAATEQLARHPLVTLRWIEAAAEEKVDPDIRDRVQAPESLRQMREAMIKGTSPVAMVAIGGMKGVIDEAKLFAELLPDRPIFTYVTTGGAAALLPQRLENSNQVVVVDNEAESLVRRFWQTQKADNDNDRPTREAERDFYVPYALVAQQVVARIFEGPDESRLEPR